MDKKAAEVKAVQPAWSEAALLHQTLVTAEENARSLLYRAARFLKLNLASMGKIARLESFLMETLHEGPAVTVSQSLSTPAALCHASQLCGMGVVGPAKRVVFNGRRLGMIRGIEWSRRSVATREALPQWLDDLLVDETNPRFVGSYAQHGGLLLDPCVECDVAMPESWVPRLLVAWGYVDSQREPPS